MCPCGAVGVDGGIGASNRILGRLSDMEDRSIWCRFENGQRIYLPAEHRPWPSSENLREYESLGW